MKRCPKNSPKFLSGVPVHKESSGMPSFKNPTNNK